MKLKNIKWYEEHGEKFVVGLLVLISLLIFWSYLAYPYRAEVDSPLPINYTPAEMEEAIVRETQKLNRELQKEEVAFKIDVPEYTDSFITRWQKADFPAKLPMPLGNHGLDPTDFVIPSNTTDEPPAGERYWVPDPPKPTNVTARAGYGVLREVNQPERMRKLDRIIGHREDRPRDFRYVSVGADFNWEQWQELVRGVKDVDARQIPEARVLEALYVTYVQLERRSSTDGGQTWSEPELVPMIPESLGERFYELSQQSKWTKQEALAEVERVSKTQRLIRKVEFPQMSVGPEWLPPDVAGELTAEQIQRFRELKAKIKQLEEKREALEQRGGPDGGGFNRMNFTDEDRQALEAAQRELNSLLGRKQGESAPEQGGWEPSSESEAGRRDRTDFGSRQGGRTPEPTRSAPRSGTAQGDQETQGPELPKVVEVWAHDLSAKPGMTYQYRLRVGIQNPLFFDPNLAGEDVTKYQQKLSLMSAPSPWSEPVTIGPDMHFWFVDSEGRGGEVRARLKVAKLYYGAWRVQEFTVEPGDPVGGQRSVTVNNQQHTIDFSLDHFVVDVDTEYPSTQVGPGAQPNAMLLMLNKESGQLVRRILQRDLNDPVLRGIQQDDVARQPALGRLP